MSLKKVGEAIKRNRSFLISAHVNLEGDALGSELALARLLRKLGKKVYVVNQDKTPLLYNFLPGVKTIIQPNIRVRDFDVALLVDCSNLDRIGSVKKLINKDKLVINIDHHVSNENFGGINWVNPRASSACEMVYEIFKKGKFKIDKDTALLLYTGIMVDTGSFRYVNTTPATHLAAADLLKYKISPEKIHNFVYASMPIGEVKMLSRLVTGFKMAKSGKIIWLVIKLGIVNEEKMRIDVTEYAFDFLRSIAGVEVAMIFREMERNKVRVNFRSRGKVNVSQLAAVFGGGGHACASGCTINRNLKTAQQLVFSRIKKLI